METQQLCTVVGSALVGGALAYMWSRPALQPVRRIGILAAMPAEVAKLKSAVQGQTEHKRGTAFTFVTGWLNGKPVVFAAANVGMVFAGSAATTMINEFGQPL